MAEERTKCPVCREEIQPGAGKCKHCGEWLGASKDSKWLLEHDDDPHEYIPVHGGKRVASGDPGGDAPPRFIWVATPGFAVTLGVCVTLVIGLIFLGVDKVDFQLRTMFPYDINLPLFHIHSTLGALMGYLAAIVAVVAAWKLFFAIARRI